MATACSIVETLVELVTFLTFGNFPSIDIQQELMEESSEALHIVLTCNNVLPLVKQLMR
jgi:hypothetical protein